MNSNLKVIHALTYPQSMGVPRLIKVLDTWYDTCLQPIDNTFDIFIHHRIYPVCIRCFRKIIILFTWKYISNITKIAEKEKKIYIVYYSFKRNNNVIKHMKAIVIYSFQWNTCTWIPFAQIEHSYIAHTLCLEVRLGGFKNSLLNQFQ